MENNILSGVFSACEVVLEFIFEVVNNFKSIAFICSDRRSLTTKDFVIIFVVGLVVISSGVAIASEVVGLAGAIALSNELPKFEP